MKSLKINGDSSSPKVLFDYKNGTLYMGGSSLPENVLEFFGPIMEWIDEYKKAEISNTEIEFNFEYLNTASTNMMARVIESLSDLTRSQTALSITWYYCHGDYDMKELGEELLEYSNANYSIIEI